MAQVRTRKRGKTWSYIFEAGQTAEGKRKVVEKGGFPTQEAAYDAGTSAYTDWKHGNIGITSERISVCDFLKFWLDKVAVLRVRPTTMQQYRSATRARIYPFFQGIILQDLLPSRLDAWMNYMLKAGLSKSTIRSTIKILRTALDYAVYPGELISSNPLHYIKVPSTAPSGIIKRSVIGLDIFQRLTQHYFFGTPMHMPLQILYHTGVRIGELVGMTWDEIDLDAKVLTLNHQIIHLNWQGHFFAPLKTLSSNRSFPLDDELVRVLKAWKAHQAKNELAEGGGYICVMKNTEGMVFEISKALLHMAPKGSVRVPMICTWPNGHFVKGEYIRHILTTEGLNAHSFRHTHATMLIENGATPKGVAGRLGHQNAEITQNLYTHDTEKIQLDTVKVFERAMQAKHQKEKRKSEQKANKK